MELYDGTTEHDNNKITKVTDAIAILQQLQVMILENNKIKVEYMKLS